MRDDNSQEDRGFVITLMVTVLALLVFATMLLIGFEKRQHKRDHRVERVGVVSVETIPLKKQSSGPSPGGTPNG